MALGGGIHPAVCYLGNHTLPLLWAPWREGVAHLSRSFCLIRGHENSPSRHGQPSEWTGSGNQPVAGPTSCLSCPMGVHPKASASFPCGWSVWDTNHRVSLDELLSQPQFCHL